MKKILSLSIVALMVIGLVAGGTWAFFSDTETSNDNTWTAGTLNLVNVIAGTAVDTDVVVTEQADGLNDKVQFGTVTPIVPGDSGTLTFTLTNQGTTDGFLTIDAATTFGEGGAATEPEAVDEGGTPVGLDTGIKVWVTKTIGETTTNILGATDAYVAMSGLAAALDAEVDVAMAAADVIIYELHWEVPTSVGNEIQGDTAELDITFTLNQIVTQP